MKVQEKSALIQEVKVVNCEKSELKSEEQSNGLFIHGNGEVNISNDFKEVKLTIVMGKRKNNNTKGFVNFTWESYERHLVNFILVQ